MARYEHLPIYKKAMDVAIHFEKVVAGFSRYHKYTLGTEFRNKSREIVPIYQNCTDNHIFKGNPKVLEKIPPQKSLFYAPKNKGLPIGNLNSQFFANVYLNGLDQFVKHYLKCRYYLRYCDDFVLLSGDRDELLRWRDQIEAYLKDNLHLELNHKREKLQPVSNGIDFLGYIVRRDYLRFYKIKKRQLYPADGDSLSGKATLQIIFKLRVENYLFPIFSTLPFCKERDEASFSNPAPNIPLSYLF